MPDWLLSPVKESLSYLGKKQLTFNNWNLYFQEAWFKILLISKNIKWCNKVYISTTFSAYLLTIWISTSFLRNYKKKIFLYTLLTRFWIQTLIPLLSPSKENGEVQLLSRIIRLNYGYLMLRTNNKMIRWSSLIASHCGIWEHVA